MRILALDDEKLILNGLVDSIREAAPTAEIVAFRNGPEVLEYIEDHKVDVAFLDIHLRGMDGLDIGRILLEQQPEVNVIYCTGHSEYMEEAFRNVRCNGYLMKPVDAAQVREELEHLRVPLRKVEEPRIHIRCFGWFEVFYDGSPMIFEVKRTKELLACLVDACGGICSNQELINLLFRDDENHDSYFKKLRRDLLETFERYGCADVILRPRGGLGIDPDAVSCDYFEWKRNYRGEYPGEYMTQYPWIRC